MVYRFLIFYLLSYSFVYSAELKAEETIAWQTYHLPPGSIRFEPNKYQGFIDKVLDLVIKEMPEYKHVLPITSLARAMTDLKEGKNVCHPGLIINEERKKYIYFSQGTIVHPTNRLIGVKGSLEDNLIDGEVDLSRFPANTSFALVKDRAYSTGYDTFAKEFIPSDRLAYISRTKIDAVFWLVANHRVDFSIAYPFELEYFLNLNPDFENNLTTYRLADTPSYSMGHIGCPKNAWGKKVITKVDAVLDRIKGTDKYRKAMTSWWEKEAETKEFKRFYQNSFLRSAKQTHSE
jgi:uncharacterized protein (TIGR02285 family)